MKRNPNGYGSVIKLSGNRTRPYMARITAGYTDKGYPRYKAIGYYENRTDALQALANYNKNPYDIDLSKSTVADMWEVFQKRRFDVISKSGQAVYKAAYKHIKPLWDMPVSNIKTYQLQSLIDNIERSWETKSHVQSLIHQLFDIAIELDICQKNYAEFIKLGPKPKSNIHSMFSDDEIKALFNNVFAYEWADTVLIMIYSGMRPSELLGIKTENVHIEDRYIQAGVKTEAGKDRIIPINNKVLPFIKKRYNPHNKFLIEENGNALSYAIYKKYFDNTMKALNMSHLPHDGRHTFASLMNTAGANKTAVKKIMGHASSDITEKVYTHKAVAELLQNVNMI